MQDSSAVLYTQNQWEFYFFFFFYYQYEIQSIYGYAHYSSKFISNILSSDFLI